MTVSDWSFYRDGRRETGHDYDAAVAAARDRQGFVWLRLHEPDEDELRRIATDFGLHPLAVEDALDPRQGTKLGHYDGLVFLVLRRVRYDGGMRDAGRLTVLAGPDVVLTVSEGDPDPVTAIADDLERRPKLLVHGPASVLYLAADSAVDEYTEAAEAFEADLTEIEAAVFDEVSGNQASRIYHAKRELLRLQRALVPLGLPVRSLGQRGPDLIPSKVQTYLRGVADHVDRLHAQLGGYDEIIGSMLQANLAQLSVAQNNDMRKITSWAAIIAVPTAIAGIYGMNFRDMPELHWRLGYPGVMLLMAALCWALYVNFKRRSWL